MSASWPQIVQSKVSLKTTFLDASVPATPQWPFPLMKTINYPAAPSNDRKGIIRINLMEDIPAGMQIISCTLNFFVFGTSGPGTIATFHRMTAAGINVQQASWNDKATATPWTAPGAVGDYILTPMDSVAVPASPLLMPIDITDIARDSYLLGLEQHIFCWLTDTVIPVDFCEVYSEHWGVPATQPYLEITYAPANNLSDLGAFQLGFVQLGAALGSISHVDSLTIGDSEQIDMTISLLDNLEVGDDTLEMSFIMALLEDLTIGNEFIYYPVLNQVGVQVRIVQPIDITMDDFCNGIWDFGHPILLNGDNARAHFNVKQMAQTFRGNVKILPGDAVMFYCPTLVVAIGDTVTYLGRDYSVAEIHTKEIGGNPIYSKAAMKLIDVALPMPKVTGLVASSNLDGTVKLTWDEVNKNIYPAFDHYDIFRSAVHPIIAVDQGTKKFTIAGEYASWFTPTETFDITDSTGNDGTYTIVAATEVAGDTVIEVSEAIPDPTADGLVAVFTFYLIGTSKSGSYTDKNLVPNATYYYVVRAVDIYGYTGDFSDAAVTTGDATKPATPEGFR